MCHCWWCCGGLGIVLVVVQCLVVCCVEGRTDDVVSGQGTLCPEDGRVDCTEQVLWGGGKGVSSDQGVSCTIEPRFDNGIGATSKQWLPTKDPLVAVQPYLYERQIHGINDSLMMMNLTFSTSKEWNNVHLDIFCPGLNYNLSHRISVSGAPDGSMVSFDCPWMDLFAYRGLCDQLGLAYSTADGSFADVVTFPRPQPGTPFFIRRSNADEQFILIPTDSHERRYLACIRPANGHKVISKFEIDGKPTGKLCTSWVEPCMNFSPKDHLLDGTHVISLAEITQGDAGQTPKNCEDSSVPWAVLKFTVGSPPVENAAVETTIIAALGICGCIAIGIAVFLWRLKRRVVREVLWLTNVTWNEHIEVFNDLIHRVSRLNAFQSKNLVVVYGKTGPKNLERDLRECFAIVMLIGPRHFSDENEHWQRIYPEFHRHLARAEFCGKLVLIQPEYLDSEMQLRGRETIVYNGRNIEDVAEAIAGDPDVIQLVKSPFYPSIRVANCVPAYARAEKRVADYKKRFDVGKFTVVNSLDDY